MLHWFDYQRFRFTYLSQTFAGANIREMGQPVPCDDVEVCSLIEPIFDFNLTYSRIYLVNNKRGHWFSLRNDHRFFPRGMLVLLALISAATLSTAQQQQFDPKLFAEKLKADFLEWKTLPTHGATLSLIEIGRETNAEEGLLVTYELYATGFPTGGLYDLVVWPAGDPGPKNLLIGVSVDQNGHLYCAGKTVNQCKSNDDAPLRVTAFSRPGKPFRYGLYNNLPRTDPAVIVATVTVIPEPIEALDGISFGERHGQTIKTDDKGNATWLLLPFVAGHIKGTTKLKVSGGSCSLSTQFDWGE
ncbi:MAG: hypothetical protein HYX26_03520 [Acidobacteriales bacterium]|nr:hypothetical protein [Terriglobales bacterium]